MHNKIFKVGIYIRLSKEDEKKVVESESITNQRALILNYLEKNEEFVLVDEYVDDGISGTSFDRPDFNRMIKDIEDNKINTIITKDLSRFGREYSDTGYYIDKYFPKKDIRFISILDNVDTLYDNTNLDIIPFKAVFNDMYAKDISKKVRSSLVTLKKQGKFTGWAAPFGYKKNPNDRHHLIINKSEAPLVKRMFQMVLDGYSTKMIADTFTDEKIPIPSVQRNLKKRIAKIKNKYLWCVRTIDEILKNPTYMGDLTQGRRKKINYKIKREIRTNKEDWIRVANTHEGIVDKETFDRVQLLLAKNIHNRNGKNIFLLSGLLYCKECGHTIGITKRKERKQAYIGCTYYRKYSKHKVCTPHTMNYYKLEEEIIKHIRSLCKNSLDTSSWKSILKNTRKNESLREKILLEIAKLTEEIELNKIKKDTIYFDKLDGIIDLDTYKRSIVKINGILKGKELKKQKLEKKLEVIDIDIISEDDYEKYINEFLEIKSPARIMIACLIDRIEISNEREITIYYKIKKPLYEKL